MFGNPADLNGSGATMQRLNPTWKPALLLSALCVIGGAFLLFHPIEGNMFHPSDTEGSSPRAPDVMEHISKEKSRVYGGLAILFGAGITWMAFYSERKSVHAHPAGVISSNSHQI